MLVLPLCFVLVFSFGERAPAGGYVPAFTFEQYANLPARGTAFLNTLLLAPLGTVLSLLIAYPLAYFLAMRADPKWRTLLLILVIVPFWTSILIRSYAWIFILGGQEGDPKGGVPAVVVVSLGDDAGDQGLDLCDQSRGGVAGALLIRRSGIGRSQERGVHRFVGTH